MEEQLQKRKTQAIKELPQDIIHDEILTRLPHKSLLRFQCVCKPWRSLFSDPDFIKIYLSRQHDQHYLESKVWKNTSKLKIISNSKETRIDTTNLFSNSLLIGSINGLICFARADVFMLWNPVIRRCKELTAAQLHSKKCERSGNWNPERDINGNCRHLFGFGYDPSRNDYKVVMVCYLVPNSKFGAVYSCNSDSWIQLSLPTGIFDIKSRSFVKSSSPAVIVKGCPYWSYSKYLTVPGKRYKRRYTVVFKFVAKKNEFKLLPDFDLDGKQGLELFNLKDRLAGMTYKYNDTFPYGTKFMYIYSFDDERSAGVWSKMYTLGAIDHGLLNCELSDQGHYRVRKLKQLVCYDPKSNRIREVVDAAPFRTERTYTPSLVFVQGMKHIMHLET